MIFSASFIGVPFSVPSGSYQALCAPSSDSAGSCSASRISSAGSVPGAGSTPVSAAFFISSFTLTVSPVSSGPRSGSVVSFSFPKACRISLSENPLSSAAKPEIDPSRLFVLSPAGSDFSRAPLTTVFLSSATPEKEETSVPLPDCVCSSLNPLFLSGPEKSSLPNPSSFPKFISNSFPKSAPNPSAKSLPPFPNPLSDPNPSKSFPNPDPNPVLFPNKKVNFSLSACNRSPESVVIDCLYRLLQIGQNQIFRL